MKAMLLTEYRRLEVVEQPDPTIGPDDVLVRVAACGICGSDIHGYDGSSGRRIPPLIMGHEAAGEVLQVGANVDRFQRGDRVTFDSTVSCGECQFCQRDQSNLCNNRMILGVACNEFRRHGAFAEYIVVPERIVYRLPDELPFEHAALVEAVSVAVHAVARSGVQAGDSALVVGSGMIGLLVIQVLRHVGCAPIFAADVDASKLVLAQQLGATDVFDVGRCELPTAVRKHTDGAGVDAAFEVVGRTETVTASIESTRKGGSITLIGNLAPTVEVPLQSIVTRELTLLGTCASSGEYPQCLELMASGAVDVSPLISAQAPLDDGPQWFDRLYAGEPGLMKVILQP